LIEARTADLPTFMDAPIAVVATTAIVRHRWKHTINKPETETKKDRKHDQKRKSYERHPSDGDGSEYDDSSNNYKSDDHHRLFDKNTNVKKKYSRTK